MNQPSPTRPRNWTIGSLINWAMGYLDKRRVESARLSAEMMLAHTLNLERMDLYLRYDQPLTPEELTAFKKLLIRRREHEPMAYILGKREFFGLEFQVGPGVLIPRSETEHLVEEAIFVARGLESPRILDLCTGSGAVALALAHNLADALITGVDISEKALFFARRNADALGLAGRIEFKPGSLYDPVAPAGGFFDIITANPPYVRADEWAGLSPQVREFEPELALVAAEDGFSVIKNIIKGAGAFLRPQGWLFMEIGAGQAARALELAAKSGIFEDIHTVPDLAGLDRVLVCQRGDYG